LIDVGEWETFKKEPAQSFYFWEDDDGKGEKGRSVKSVEFCQNFSMIFVKKGSLAKMASQTRFLKGFEVPTV